MQFAFSPAGKPLLPLALTLAAEGVAVDGLLDSGADVNVLPWSVGQALRAVWNERRTTIRLGGVLAGNSAMPLLVSASVGGWAPVRLAFAWCRTDQVPLVLGQTNFFMEFDVCFFRSRLAFSVVPSGQRTA